MGQRTLDVQVETKIGALPYQASPDLVHNLFRPTVNPRRRRSVEEREWRVAPQEPKSVALESVFLDRFKCRDQKQNKNFFFLQGLAKRRKSSRFLKEMAS